MSKEHRRMRREWRDLNKRNDNFSIRKVFIIIFWSSLLLFSILRTATSMTMLFDDKASVDIIVQNVTVVKGFWMTSFDGWAYSDANKILKISLNFLFLLYTLWIYSRFIKYKVSPNNTKIFLGLTIVIVIYSITDLPTFKDNQLTDRDIKISFIQNYRAMVPLELIELKKNFMASYLCNQFLIELLIIVVPVSIAIISYICSEYFDKPDSVYV